MPNRQAWLIVGVLGLGLLVAYVPQLLHQFPVPVGGDSYSHLQTAERLLFSDFKGAFEKYPPLFHALPALVSVVTGAELVTSFAWATPLILFLAAVSLAYVTWRWLKSWPAALVAFGLSLLVTLQPFQIWQDGGFPNVLASYVFLPIGLWALLEYTQAPSRQALARYLLVTVLIFFTHHLTTATFLAISLVYILSFSLVARSRKAPAGPWLHPAFWLATAGLVLASVLAVTAFGYRILRYVLSVDTSFPFVHFTRGLDNPNALLPLGDIPVAIGLGLALLAGIGLVALWLQREQAWQTKLFFFVWIASLLVLSQAEALVFPVRFARELGAPATILAAYAATMLVAVGRTQALRLASALLLAVLLFPGLTTKYQKVEALPASVEFGTFDLQATQYLRDHLASGDCLFIVPRNRYYQHFLPEQQVFSYHLTYQLREIFDALPDPDSVARLAECEYVVAERIPAEDDWAGRLSAAGFQLVARFDGATRGVTIFVSPQSGQ